MSLVLFLTFLFLSDPQSSTDAPYIARHVGLRCGIPIPVPALTVNRLCGSGFQSIISGAQVSKPPRTKNIMAEMQMFMKCSILLDPPVQSNRIQYYTAIKYTYL